MDYPVSVIIDARHGGWLKDDIEVVHEKVRPLPNEVEKKVEAIWAKELERNPNLTNGNLLTARRIETLDGGKRLRLTCGISDYKRFMGTTHETVAPHLPEEHIHRATGFLSVTITSDDYILIGVRSPKIDYGLLRHAVPAGRLRPDENNPFNGLQKEFREELGVEPYEIKSIKCLGIAADKTYGRLNYEFCCRSLITLTADEVITRARKAASAHEHCQLELFPLTMNQRKWSDLLLSDPDGFVPTGWAGLLLYFDKCYDRAPQLGRFDYRSVHRTYEQHMGRRLDMLIKK